MYNIMGSEIIVVMLSTLCIQCQWEFSLLDIILTTKIMWYQEIDSTNTIVALFQILIMLLLYEKISDYSFLKFLSNAGGWADKRDKKK